MNGIPRFSDVHKILIRVFYPSDKAITIFTEDKPSDKLMYSLILSRLVGSEVKINNIIPLGSKNNVIEKSILAKSTQQSSIFIVDGDIKLMFGEELETENLISLKRYCIENYLCCEHGILDYLHLKIGTDREQIKTNLDFESFLSKNGKLLLKLYHRLAISHKYNCGCSFKNATVFFNNPGPPIKIDSARINEEIKIIEIEIKNKFKRDGYKNFRQKMNSELKILIEQNPLNFDTIIKILSGKDQLLPLLRLKIDKLDTSSKAIDNDQLKRILAERFDIRVLQYLKTKIIQLAK